MLNIFESTTRAVPVQGHLMHIIFVLHLLCQTQSLDPFDLYTFSSCPQEYTGLPMSHFLEGSPLPSLPTEQLLGKTWEFSSHHAGLEALSLAT